MQHYAKTLSIKSLFLSLIGLAFLGVRCSFLPFKSLLCIAKQVRFYALLHNALLCKQAGLPGLASG